MSNLVRLQKFIAECGVAPRRQAEKLIVSGNVKANGKILTTHCYEGTDSVT